MQIERHAVGFLDGRNCADVIVMSVSIDNAVKVPTILRDQRLNVVRLTARINDDRIARVVCDDMAILAPPSIYKCGYMHRHEDSPSGRERLAGGEIRSI